MFGTQHLETFVLLGLLLNAIPGPDTMYILGRTVAQGRAAGIASVFGINCGCLVHTLIAAFGLSAILLASPLAFLFVKFAGAAYLVYIGCQMLFERKKSSDSAEPIQPDSTMTIFRQAVITNILNPKVGIFFIAFLPQFVSSAATNKTLSFLFLGLVFIVNGTLYCLSLVLGASWLIERFRKSSAGSLRFKRFTGLAFVGIAAKLALEK